METPKELERLQQIWYIMAEHGRDVIIALAIIVVGLVAVKWLNQTLKKGLSKLPLTPARASVVRNIICVIMIAIVAMMASVEIGLPARPVLQILTIISLAAVGIIAVFRPLIPTLPFRVGNTVKAGDLLGKIEATTVLNTRMRTFDGKTVFIPNQKILNDIVINYHYTPSRRFKIDIYIRYNEDLMKAKQVLEAIMIEDTRVLIKPRPVVYVLDLANGYVKLGGRGWVDNLKYWQTKCDLLEKTKLCFDHEGITFAYPQLQVHHYGETPDSVNVAEMISEEYSRDEGGLNENQ
ncbi:MAG: mechanosensitive ion channel family protein [Desulfobacterales bacterium]|nr:mechanosensitive ion channel family protein [Desulfobacterales bacterium]